MTVTSAAAGADSNAEGAMQVKMVTRSGSNTWHGGLFEQHRNQSLNANAYFNNLNGTAPRDHLVFNQFGGLVGGPDQAATSFSSSPTSRSSSFPRPTPSPPARCSRRRPSTESSAIAIPPARFARSISTSSPPPTGSSPRRIRSSRRRFQQIAALTDGVAGLKSRIATNADYNRNNLDFQSKGGNYRRFPTMRMDYNVTEKHHLEFV